MITNSHMGILYHPYEMFSTGGAIGNALFFFCSGFTLFLGRLGRFDNWYKRRINRIYPTVFAWAILGAFIFGYHNDMKYTIINGGGWFVTCIMICYIVLYFIRRYMFDKLKLTFGIAAAICVAWYLSIDKPINYGMYGDLSYFRWCYYFLFMLLGAILGVSSRKRFFHFKRDFMLLIVSIAFFYLYSFAGNKIAIIGEWQIFSLLPLLFIIFYFYKVCNSRILKRCYEHKVIGWCIKVIGGLCLEIYLVQFSLFTDKMNGIFPLNIPIMFIIILFMAYILRCVARIFAQTFKEQEYDWKEIVRFV